MSPGLRIKIASTCNDLSALIREERGASLAMTSNALFLVVSARYLLDEIDRLELEIKNVQDEARDAMWEAQDE